MQKSQLNPHKLDLESFCEFNNNKAIIINFHCFTGNFQTIHVSYFKFIFMIFVPSCLKMAASAYAYGYKLLV